MRDTIGVVDCPLHRLHCAEAAADDCGPTVDAQYVRKLRLRSDPIAHGDHRKIGTINAARFGIDRPGTGAAVAATDIVEAHDEKSIRVDRLAGSNAGIPPTGSLVGRTVETGSVMMARQRVADEHGIRPRGIQFPVRFVDELPPRQYAPAEQCHGRFERLVTRRHETDGVWRKGVLHKAAESKATVERAATTVVRTHPRPARDGSVALEPTVHRRRRGNVVSQIDC
jgi:hypothetical protein